MFTIPRKPASTSITSSRGLTAGEDALLSELQKINAALSNPPTVDQTLSSFKANTLLQFLGILAATVFGIFSILAWLAATKSNEISSNALSQALQSNQLALLAYCVSGGNTTSAAAICANVLSQASGEFAPIVASALPSVQTSIPVISENSTASTTTRSVFSTTTTLPTSEGSAPSTTTSSSSVQVTGDGSTSSTIVSLATTTSTSFATSTSNSISNGVQSTGATSPSNPPAATQPASAGSATSSSAGTTNIGAIVGGVLGAIAAVATVFLYVWRRRAYREMLDRTHPQEREKFSEGM